MISKEEFVECINEIKKTYEFQNGFNDTLHSLGAEGSIYAPECATTTLKLLHLIFKRVDLDNWIERFCIEFDFGNKYKEHNKIKDYSGKVVDLSSAESLYDELMSRVVM